MQLRFTYHVQDKILERIISTEDIKHTIRNPDFKEILDESKIKVQKYLDTKTMVVVYSQLVPYRTHEYIIITSYYK